MKIYGEQLAFPNNDTNGMTLKTYITTEMMKALVIKFGYDPQLAKDAILLADSVIEELNS
jgi:hypothetical protein